jgi:hypothetical protein
VRDQQHLPARCGNVRDHDDSDDGHGNGHDDVDAHHHQHHDDADDDGDENDNDRISGPFLASVQIAVNRLELEPDRIFVALSRSVVLNVRASFVPGGDE